jgi:hypothetical protein
MSPAARSGVRAHTSRNRRAKAKESEVGYLFAVSFSSVKHFDRAWYVSSSAQGKYYRRVEMTKVVPLHRTDLSYSVKTHPWHVRI